MAFSDDIALMQAAIYDRYGLPGSWTPSGGRPPVTVTFLPDSADAIGSVGGIGRQVVARRVLRCRVSEIVSAGVEPRKGDPVVFGDENLQIIAPPMRKDPRQLEWTLECGS